MTDSSLRIERNVTARELIEELIVRRGLSYVDAIAKLEREGKVIAAPYFEAANELRAAARAAAFGQERADG